MHKLGYVRRIHVPASFGDTRSIYKTSVYVVPCINKQIEMILFKQLFKSTLSPLISSISKYHGAEKVLKVAAYTLKRFPELEQIIQTVTDSSQPNWEKLHSDIKNKVPKLSGVDGAILATCEYMGNNKAAETYFRHIENNSEVPLGLIIQYLNALNTNSSHISESQKQDIQRLCRNIQEKYPVLDVISAKVCIQAIMNTCDWRMGIEIFNKCKETHTRDYCLRLYHALIIGLFQVNMRDDGFKYLNEFVKLGGQPQPRLFLSYFNSIQDPKMDIKKMLDWWLDYEVYLPEKVLSACITKCRELGFSAKYTTISHNGHCQQCSSKLLSGEVSNEEFEQMKKSVKELLYVKDIYTISTPAELERFHKFIEAVKPYDVVIDGLNTFYVGSNSTSPNASLMVEQIVDYFVQRQRRVVILIRRHLIKHPAFIRLQKRANIFVVENLSYDDIYLLVAAMEGGKHTGIVSRDYMRSHVHKISNSGTKKFFQKWLMTNRYDFGKQQRQVQILVPPKYYPYSQKQGNYYHIPRTSDTKSPQLSSFPKEWACIRLD